MKRILGLSQSNEWPGSSGRTNSTSIAAPSDKHWPATALPRWKRVRIALLRRVVQGLFALLTRPTVAGHDQIPRSGPCVLVFNHISNLDPPLIFSQIPRLELTALVAAEYRTNGFYRRAIEWAGGAWIRRGASDRAALRYGLDALEKGWIVGIAPEGGRSKDGRMREAKPGPAFLALHAGVPILPVGVTGTNQVSGGLRRLRRVPVSVTFGPPFELPPQTASSQKAHLLDCSTEIMCRIAALVPPDQRGVYANHPRLPHLLNVQTSESDPLDYPGKE